MPEFLKNITQTTIKHRRIIIIVFTLWAFWFFGLGALTTWFFSRSGLDRFPDLTNQDRLLILAPHIDDEVIGSGGLIQQAKTAGTQIKIVYMTNGDNNLPSVFKEDKSLNINPNDFIALGEQRMQEANKATAFLGLDKNNLIFLGFPDRGLTAMLSKHYDENNPYSSQGTKLTYNPYQGTYKIEQSYCGANVVSNLKEIINDFKPTLIIVSHPRDLHPDHKATYLFLEKVLNEIEIKPKVYTYLVHFPFFPPSKKLIMDSFLYPPKKLFTQKGWLSFDLSPMEENNKLTAVKQNISQQVFSRTYDLLQSFVKKNEIFEEIN